jgi:putative RNA 2'-phosphotransferase
MERDLHKCKQLHKSKELKMNQKTISKFLSLVLRHKPELIDITLDENGWTGFDELIKKSNQSDTKKLPTLTREIVMEVVESNEKQRFAVSEDGQRIRANQGHSVKVDLGLESQTPPDLLYHGTATRFLDSIMKDGLVSKSRNHVHLSKDHDTAVNVGQRHGKVIVLLVDTKQMVEDGLKFFLSKNGVWLTDEVAPKYLTVEGQ